MRAPSLTCLSLLLLGSTVYADDKPLLQPFAQPPMAPPTKAAAQLQALPQEATAGEAPATKAAQAGAEAPPPPKAFWNRLEYDGLIDFHASANLADPTSNTHRARAFDTVSGGGLHLTYAEVTLALPAAPVGFRLDVGFGNTMDVLFSADPAANPASGVDPNHALWHKNFQQAYVSILIPVLKGITVDVGKFVAPAGIEVVESRDNWNWSRGLLFTYAVPLFHTGLRLTMPVTDTLTVMAGLFNGWNTFLFEGSQMRTGHVQLAWNPRPWASLIVQYIGGYSGGADVRVGGDTVRHLVDAVAIFKPTDKLSLAINGDFGYDNGNHWGGVAVYGKYQVLPWLASALRGEYFSDPEGFALDGLMLENESEGAVAQDLWEVTVTPLEFGFSLGKASLLLLAEYRHDQSTAAYFDGKAAPGMPASTATPRKGQDTVSGAFISYF